MIDADGLDMDTLYGLGGIYTKGRAFFWKEAGAPGRRLTDTYIRCSGGGGGGLSLDHASEIQWHKRSRTFLGSHLRPPARPPASRASARGGD